MSLDSSPVLSSSSPFAVAFDSSPSGGRAELPSEEEDVDDATLAVRLTGSRMWSAPPAAETVPVALDDWARKSFLSDSRFDDDADKDLRPETEFLSVLDDDDDKALAEFRRTDDDPIFFLSEVVDGAVSSWSQTREMIGTSKPWE